MLRVVLLPLAIWLTYLLLAATWRKRVVADPSARGFATPGGACVFAHWHGDEYTILHLVRRYRIATMTSTSRDGRLVDRVIRWLGGRTCPGSSTRGGSRALRGLIRLCRNGHNASMALDGPRGPRHRIKPGVFMLARAANCPIVPVGVACDRAHVFTNSWNQARLPRPFARVVLVFGPAQQPGSPGPDGDYDLQIQQLARGMRAASADAERLLRDAR